MFPKSLLNENPNRTLPFHWTINPYRGCSFGCSYCFARYTHTFLEGEGCAGFDRRVYVKLSSAQVLRDELRPGLLRDRPVAIGTATDPYQPAEAQFGVTRSILEVLCDCPDLDLSITTKSPLVLRDLELLREIARTRPLQVNVTITTLDARVSRLVEGRAPSPRIRLDTIRRLARASVPTALFVMPVMPGINDSAAELERLLSAARDAGAMDAVCAPLRLDAISGRIFHRIIAEHFPHLLPRYAALAGDALSSTIRECRSARAIEQRFAELRRRAGFVEPPARRRNGPIPGEQLALGI